MKLKFDIEIMDMDDECVAVPVGDHADEFHGVLKVNDTARFILELLREDITEEGIVEAVLKEYTGEREQIASYIHEYLAVLQDAKLLV